MQYHLNVCIITSHKLQYSFLFLPTCLCFHFIKHKSHMSTCRLRAGATVQASQAMAWTIFQLKCNPLTLLRHWQHGLTSHNLQLRCMLSLTKTVWLCPLVLAWPTQVYSFPHPWGYSTIAHNLVYWCCRTSIWGCLERNYSVGTSSKWASTEVMYNE